MNGLTVAGIAILAVLIFIAGLVISCTYAANYVERVFDLAEDSAVYVCAWLYLACVAILLIVIGVLIK